LIPQTHEDLWPNPPGLAWGPSVFSAGWAFSLEQMPSEEFDDMMERHSILVGKCYRDRLGAIYKVVGFDGNGVRCVLYHRNDRGGFI